MKSPAIRMDTSRIIVTIVTIPSKIVNLSLYAFTFETHLLLCLRNARMVRDEAAVTVASGDSSHNMFEWVCFFRLCNKKISSPEANSSCRSSE